LPSFSLNILLSFYVIIDTGGVCFYVL
jgi:hypothetical protein